VFFFFSFFFFIFSSLLLSISLSPAFSTFFFSDSFRRTIDGFIGHIYEVTFPDVLQNVFLSCRAAKFGFVHVFGGQQKLLLRSQPMQRPNSNVNDTIRHYQKLISSYL